MSKNRIVTCDISSFLDTFPPLTTCVPSISGRFYDAIRVSANQHSEADVRNLLIKALRLLMPEVRVQETFGHDELASEGAGAVSTSVRKSASASENASKTETTVKAPKSKAPVAMAAAASPHGDNTVNAAATKSITRSATAIVKAAVTCTNSTTVTKDTYFKDTHISCSFLGDDRYRPDITLCAPCERLVSPLHVKAFIALTAYGSPLEDDAKGKMCTFLTQLLFRDGNRNKAYGVLYNGVAFVLAQAADLSGNEDGRPRRQNEIKISFTQPIVLAKDKNSDHQLFLRFLLASNCSLSYNNPKLASAVTDRYVIMQRLGVGESAVVERLVEKHNPDNECVVKRFYDQRDFVSECKILIKLSEVVNKHGYPTGFTFPQLLKTDSPHLALIMSPVCHPASKFNVPLTQKSLFALIDFVKWCAVKAQLVHYDLCSDNIMYVQAEDGSYEVCVVDWTHAYPVGALSRVSGSARTAHSEVVRGMHLSDASCVSRSSIFCHASCREISLKNVGKITVTPKHALHSLVRLAYLMLFPSANMALTQKLGTSKIFMCDSNVAAKIIDFWQNELARDPWCNITATIDKSDGGSSMYQELKDAFKPVFRAFSTIYGDVDVEPINPFDMAF